MCRVRVTQFLACGHHSKPEKQCCGRFDCQPIPEQNQVDRLCPECQRRQSPSIASHVESTSSRLSTQTSTSQKMPGPRRMSLNPRENLRIQLEDLARQHSESSISAAASPDSRRAENSVHLHGGSPMSTKGSTPRAPSHHAHPAARLLQDKSHTVDHGVSGPVGPGPGHVQSNGSTSSQSRLPVEYPPPPPNLRKQEKSRERTPTEPSAPSEPVPYTPRSRRRSTRNATWIGLSPHGNPPVPSLSTNCQFVSQHPASFRPQQPSQSSLQQQSYTSPCVTNNQARYTPIVRNGNLAQAGEQGNFDDDQKPRKSVGHSPHVSYGSRFYHDPSIW